MRVEANAKVNFTLEVFGRRADGYHALRSVVMPISLCDTLDVETTDDGEIVSDTGYADDLCVKAARILKSSVSGLPSSSGARIRVAKRIPAGGGLGGGSADAAAVLRALNDLWQLGLSRERLADVGASVGSDVPALVFDVPVVMEGRGERVKPIEGCSRTGSAIPSARPQHLVLVNPGVHSSTREVYANCAGRSPDGGDATAKMVAALGTGKVGKIAAALMNDLQPPAVRLHPEIALALEALRASGVAGAMMSGSGSCVFGLVPDASTATAVSAELGRRGFRVWPVQTR